MQCSALWHRQAPAFRYAYPPNAVSRSKIVSRPLLRLSEEQDWRLIVTEMGTRSARANQ